MDKFDTLAHALEKNTPAAHPVEDAEKILAHYKETLPTATHAIVFVNQDFCSSNFGAWSVVAVGPDCSIKTPEEIETLHLNDLPSQRQYPVAYVQIGGQL